MLDHAAEVLVALADAQRFLLRRPHIARIVLAATALTVIGSSYYHLAPDNARLVRDRLPTRTTEGTPDGVRSRDVGPRWRP
jgi:hypothetical protein